MGADIKNKNKKKTHILIQTAFAQPFIHAHIKSLCAAALLSCTSSNLWLPELFSLLLPRAAVYSKMVPEEEGATDALKYTKQQTDTVWDEMPNIQESSAQWRALSLFLCLPSARLRRRTTKAEETFDESKCSGLIEPCANAALCAVGSNSAVFPLWPPLNY